MNIIIYTQPGCSKCEVLKRLMNKKNLSFTEKTDIEFLIKNGFNSTPVLSVNNELMDFSKAVNFIKNIDKGIQ